MKGFNFKAQASTILAAAVGLTLFASQAVYAGGPKKSDRTKQKSVGTNNGGGGSVIVCPGQKPVLTDLWEAERSNLSLKGTTVQQRLTELRRMNVLRANEVIARNFVSYLAAKNNEPFSVVALAHVRKLLYQMRNEALTAIDIRPKQTKEFNISQYEDGPADFMQIIVDPDVQDPHDSGIVKGLAGSGCREVRVAVTQFEIGGGVEDKPRRTIIRIRKPELFLEMPIIDQYALLLGHEVIHAESDGNVGFIEGIGKTQSSSEGVRRLNAWITLTKEQDFEHIAYRPEGYRVVSCSAVSNGSDRPGYLADRIHFNLFLKEDAKETLVEITSYKDTNLWQSTIAFMPVTEKSFLIPKHVNTEINFLNGEVGTSFDFKMEIPGQKVQGEIVQMELGSNFFRDLPQGARVTHFNLEFIQGPKQSVITQVVNGKGEIEYSGETLCYRRK